jgi:hypothetical protein
VSQIYTLFTPDLVIEPAEISEEAVIGAWERCRRLKVPPGYKDKGKDDSGVGDYLIWRSILRIAEQETKPVVFVSGEKKADWCIRSHGEPLNPRPELVAEYHQASGGQAFYLIPLSELVGWFYATSDTVEDLKKAEHEQLENALARSVQANWLGFRPDLAQKILDLTLKGR